MLALLCDVMLLCSRVSCAAGRACLVRKLIIPGYHKGTQSRTIG